MSELSTINQHHIKTQFADDPDVVATALAMGVRSIERVEDLPESLRWVPAGAPGLLFWHYPLGGGEPVPQLRPDVPDGPKYLFPKGSGSVISIALAMQERLQADTYRSCQVLILEGSKQMIFGATFADHNTIVVGIQGCYGFSQNGLALSSLDELCQGRHVIAGFDADISSNQQVYSAAESLSLALTTVGATSVTFLKVPGSKKIGLDDYLARRSAANRRAPLAAMIKEAVPLQKIKKPRQAAKRDAHVTSDLVSTVLGQIVEFEYESMDDNGKMEAYQSMLAYAGEVDGRRTRRRETLLDAAVTIVGAVEVIDDLTQGAEPRIFYDLKVQYGRAEDAIVRVIHGVAYSELKYVERWLERLGGDFPRVTLGLAGTSPQGQNRIAQAIKGFDDPDEIKRKEFLRTGWYFDASDGTAYWLDAGGAHGPEGKTDLLRAKLEGSLSSMDVPGFVEGPRSVEEAAASFRSLVGVCDFFNDPTPWIALVSALIWSVFGGNPDAVLFLIGPHGVGKTTVVSTVSAMLGSAWGPGKPAMVSLQGSPAFLADVTRQIHHSLVIADDARDRPSLSSQQEQDNAIDQLVRVGYSGGGGARGKKILDQNRNWSQSSLTNNRPFVVIAGERIPDSTPLSTVERGLVVEMTADSSMKPAGATPSGESGVDHMENLARSESLRPALSYFLFKTAKRITDAARGADGSAPITDLDQWRIRTDEMRSQYSAAAMAKHWPPGADVSERVRKVAATFLAGTTLLTTFMVEEGFCGDDEATKVQDEWHGAIVAAVLTHAQANLSESDGSRVIIDTLRGAVATGKGRMVGERFEDVSAPYRHKAENENTPIIGAFISESVDGNETEVVAILVGVTKKILADEGLNFPPKGLARRLGSALIKTKGGELSHVKRIKDIDGAQRYYFIPLETWSPRSAEPMGALPEASAVRAQEPIDVLGEALTPSSGYPDDDHEEWAPAEEGPHNDGVNAWLYEDEEPIDDVDEAWSFDDDELPNLMVQAS